jgi:hypothetical protein
MRAALYVLALFAAWLDALPVVPGPGPSDPSGDRVAESRERDPAAVVPAVRSGELVRLLEGRRPQPASQLCVFSVASSPAATRPPVAVAFARPADRALAIFVLTRPREPRAPPTRRA